MTLKAFLERTPSAQRMKLRVKKREEGEKERMEKEVRKHGRRESI